jgi:hypothetical protein
MNCGIAILLCAGAQITVGAGAAAPQSSSARLAIDADVGNGMCSPLDTTSSVAVGEPVAVALCLLDADKDPVGGELTIARLSVAYGPPLTGAVVPSDVSTDLDNNPDWNQTSLSHTGSRSRKIAVSLLAGRRSSWKSHPEQRDQSRNGSVPSMAYAMPKSTV